VQHSTQNYGKCAGHAPFHGCIDALRGLSFGGRLPEKVCGERGPGPCGTQRNMTKKTSRAVLTFIGWALIYDYCAGRRSENSVSYKLPEFIPMIFTGLVQIAVEINGEKNHRKN